MRHPIELPLQKVMPLQAKPRLAPEDSATASQLFAHLLAEAEAVRDVVRVSGAVPAGAMAGTLRSAWDFLCARMPWTAPMGEPVLDPSDRRKRPGRR